MAWPVCGKGGSGCKIELVSHHSPLTERTITLNCFGDLGWSGEKKGLSVGCGMQGGTKERDQSLQGATTTAVTVAGTDVLLGRGGMMKEIKLEDRSDEPLAVSWSVDCETGVQVILLCGRYFVFCS